MSPQNSDQFTRRQMLKTTAGIVAASLAAPQVLVGASSRHRPIRVAFLGAAHVHLERYARILADVDFDHVTVTAVYDETPAIAQIAHELTGGEKMQSLEQLLGRDDVDGVIILSENIKHERYAIAAAEAGKHMFVEKPLDIRADRAERIAEAVEKAGVIFQTGYFMQSMAQLRFLREALRQGQFGKLTRLRLQYAHGGSLGTMWDGHHAWMIDPAQVGRGALGDLGIHSLNALLWMNDEDPIRDISAYIGTASDKNHGIDDYGEAMLHFESGLIATVGAGYVDRNDVNRIEISGTEGHAYMNRGRLFINSPAITGTTRERYWSEFPDSLPHPFMLFLNALEGSDVPLVSVTDAARDVKVMDEIYRVATNV